MMHRPTVLMLLVAVAIVATVGAVYTQLQRQTATRTQLSEDLQFGGDFQMVNTEDETVTQEDILGTPSVMFFGFTFCPDICPTTLADMSGMMEALGDDADKMDFIFVSVDPERDTPEKMKEYLSFFDERIRGFTGTPAQVEAMAQNYGIYYKKVALEDGSYTMDHTASVYLFDSAGEFSGTIDLQENRETALAKLERLADEAGEGL